MSERSRLLSEDKSLLWKGSRETSTLRGLSAPTLVEWARLKGEEAPERH